MMHVARIAGRQVGKSEAAWLEAEVRYCGTQGARGALYHPGPKRWYALRVAPQREDQAEAWLKLRGVYSFHPVQTRKVRRFGKVREYDRRYLPGYVFASFAGDPVVHGVLACPFITGALVRSDGVWGVLEPRKLRAIHAMRGLDAETEEARRVEVARRKRLSAVRVGDAALFRSGPFEAFDCEVIEVKAAGGVKVKLSLFGREVVSEASPDDLERVRKPG